MSEEYYLNYKDEIEREEKINRRALVQMHKDEKASRAVHSKAWGKDLKKMLGLSAENGYTPEKMAEIDSLIQQIENSKELVRRKESYEKNSEYHDTINKRKPKNSRTIKDAG